MQRIAQGNEIETVMILGDVVNKTMPAILCDEDDVAGNHTALLSGSVSPEQLDYLALEDFLHQAAEQMFIRALF